MKKNDLFEMTITDMGTDGEGIGRYEGMTFFVKDALTGDTILARAMKIKKNYGYARVEKMIKPSPDRTVPECLLHQKCGGCQIQALSYAKQLEYKENKVRNALMRIGGFSGEELDAVMEPVVGMDTPFRYRNKAQFPVGYDKEGNIVAGFYAARTHCIIPVEDCLLGVEENKEVLEAVKTWMTECSIPAYDEKTGSGLVRHVLIRYGFSTGQIMVCLVINGTKLPAQQKLTDRLQNIPGMTSVSFNVNMEKTNVILGNETKCIQGLPYITDSLHLLERLQTSDKTTRQEFRKTDTAVSYHISPQSFYQVNPLQTEKLYSIALDYAGLTGEEAVWDLYCGIGTISLFLSQKAKQVYGVEIVPQAVEDAKNNAKLNGIANAEFFVGKAEEVLPAFYSGTSGTGTESAVKADTKTAYLRETDSPKAGTWNKDMRHPDVIVVDPPRKGCDEACLATMLKMQPQRIVYVSCDPATLARDLRILCDGGYGIVRARCVDLFGNSVHVETVVQLSLKKDTPRIEVMMKPNEESNYKPVEKGTYQNIKDYILEKYGLKVHILYIAQIKDKCGLGKERAGNNWAKNEDAKVPKCPPEKEAAIMDAFRHFGMI